ncbi:MAG: hypothetical protein HY898_19770 [Deltaproteobacteria bacterium]|nr:hypothetical protein [Deltaproteobacteria bacterium]
MSPASFTKTRSLAQRVARLASESLGAPMWLRDYPAQAEGDLDYAVIGVDHGGLWRALAAVNSIDSAAVLSSRAAAPALVGFTLNDARSCEACSAVIADYVRNGSLDELPFNALDAAFGLLDALRQTIEVPGGRWRPSVWGQWEGSTASGTSIELGGDGDLEWNHLVQLTQAADGVDAVFPAAAMAASPIRFHLRAPQDFLGALQDMLGRVRDTVDGRATFRNRALPLGQAGERIRQRLKAARAVRGTFALQWSEGKGFPSGWPDGVIWRNDHLGQHACVLLRESERGVHVSAGGCEETFTRQDDLDAWLPRILSAVEEEGSRLTADKLEPGRSYGVIAEFAWGGRTFTPGQVLRFEKADYVPRDAYHLYQFRGQSPGTPDLLLAEASDSDLVLLRRLHEILAPRSARS